MSSRAPALVAKLTECPAGRIAYAHFESWSERAHGENFHNYYYEFSADIFMLLKAEGCDKQSPASAHEYLFKRQNDPQSFGSKSKPIFRIPLNIGTQTWNGC